MYEKYVVKAWEEDGYKVPYPCERIIKHIFAPDKRGINELTFSFAMIPPGGAKQTKQTIINTIKEN